MGSESPVKTSDESGQRRPTDPTFPGDGGFHRSGLRRRVHQAKAGIGLTTPRWSTW